jgi:hypothetical protein
MTIVPLLMRAILPGLLALVLLPAAPARPQAGDAPATPSATEINKQLTNPVSSLWSIAFQQNNYRLGYETPESGERWSSNLLFQPVLPVSITKEWNLITRPVIPLFVSQPHPDEENPFHANRSTAFGDTAFLQLASPGPDLVGGWLLGVGPTWVFPTAGSDYTGSGRWQVGPAALAGYLSEKWIAGALFQNWWSFAGSNDREDTNSMNLQPFFSYFLRDGWSVGYSGNILANWKANGSGDVWTVPIGVAVAKVVKLGPLPVRVSLAGQYMVVSPDEFGQEWNVQIMVSPVLPKLVRGQLADPASLEFGLPDRR